MTTRYPPLTKTDSEIRLLSIDRLYHGQPILYHLEVVSLDVNPRLSALSYVCSDPNDTGSLIINDEPSGVDTNLTTAFRHATHHRKFAFRNENTDNFWL